MRQAAIAGIWYFVAVFAAGFVLGTLRMLILLPLIGETAAVFVELPVILAICWIVAGWVIRWQGVAARPVPRWVMGGLAFALLMLAELMLSVWVAGRPAALHFAHFLTVAGAAGLLGQVVFAIIPTIRLRTS